MVVAIGVGRCVTVGMMIVLNRPVSGWIGRVFGVISVVCPTRGVVGIIAVFLVGRLCLDQQITTMLGSAEDDRRKVDAQGRGNAGQSGVRTSPDSGA